MFINYLNESNNLVVHINLMVQREGGGSHDKAVHNISRRRERSNSDRMA